jgi:hypothetical protein
VWQSKVREARDYVQQMSLIKNALKKLLVLKLEEMIWKSDYEPL